MSNLQSLNKIKTKKIRVGRGIGSGKGKTSGRGVKGQKSRSGVAIKSFEGGQLPLFRRLPKRGFNPIKKLKYAKLNLNKLQTLIEKKKINDNQIINLKLLKSLKLVDKSFNKLKILGNGDIKSKFSIEAHSVSKGAKVKLENSGSSIVLKNNS